MADRYGNTIYNEADPKVAKILAYDGIAEVSGKEWRDLIASSPASRRDG
jgi:hypothetical protein